MNDHRSGAARERWNRNIHYHRQLLALGPASRGLDVGCGAGMLTRQLAPHCDMVIGIDPHEPSIHEARSLTTSWNVEFVVGNVLTHDFEPESFDLIVSVAALHHFDAEVGLNRFVELLRPGGRLGIVGIGRPRYPRDLPRAAIAATATQLQLRMRRTKAWAHSAPMVWPPPLTDHQMRSLITRVLPGAEFRRRLHGRHTITWTKPVV